MRAPKVFVVLCALFFVGACSWGDGSGTGDDDSPGGARTHGLVDDGLDLLVPLLPFLGTPPGLALCERATAALARAGIRLAAGGDEAAGAPSRE